MAARMPMIATTTSSSINVKPLVVLAVSSWFLLVLRSVDRHWDLRFGSTVTHVRWHQPITEPSLKIGRYIEMTRPPMITPRNRMTIGSIRVVRLATMLSTSSS